MGPPAQGFAITDRGREEEGCAKCVVAMDAWADHLPASLEQEFRASRSEHLDATAALSHEQQPESSCADVGAKHHCRPARRRRQRRPRTTGGSSKSERNVQRLEKTRFGGTTGHGARPPSALLPLARSRTTRPRTSDSGHCRSQRHVRR